MTVEAENLAQVTDVSGYDALVVGSGVYLGNWLTVMTTLPTFCPVSTESAAKA